MYIVLEGIVGSWKTTQVQKLGEYFRSIWKEVVLVREPGSTPDCRGYSLSCSSEKNGKMRWCIHLRMPISMQQLAAQTLQTVVKPARERWAIVISDRSFLSSCAIQGEAQWLGIDTILQVNSEAIDWILPDIILYLDIDIDLALGRTSDIYGDKFEKEGKRILWSNYSMISENVKDWNS